MLIIDSPYHDAYFNIASEEYLLQKYPREDIFLLYINAPSIIVGKFQNTMAEINLDYVRENDIKVVRRLSGGGSVYHDLGNLNFSFHTLSGGNDFMDFSAFTEPVLRLLNKLGIEARLEGRNDLLVEGKKFSGNAKFVKNGKMVQHGTILFDSRMDVLADALKVNPLKFVDKAVKSNRARVVNLVSYFPEGTTIASFKQLLLDEMLSNNPAAQMYTFTEEDKRAVEELVIRKYSTWEWNYGFSPNYNFRQAIKIPAGFIELHLDVHNGYIVHAKIFGDFFASHPIEELEEKLRGQRHDIATLASLLDNIDLSAYFGNVKKTEIIELFK